MPKVSKKKLIQISKNNRPKIKSMHSSSSTNIPIVKCIAKHGRLGFPRTILGEAFFRKPIVQKTGFADKKKFIENNNDNEIVFSTIDNLVENVSKNVGELEKSLERIEAKLKDI